MLLTWGIALEVILIGISLSMDALAVSVTDGLCYRNLTKRNGVIIPVTFGIFQGVMPLIGFFVAFGLGQAFNEIFDKFDHWIAFVLLLGIGGKMLIDAFKEMRSKEEEITPKQFSLTEVLIQGVATSIDALFVGVSFGVQYSIPTVLVSVAIIGCITFTISLIALIIGVKVGNVFKNKAGITEIIGGLMLIGIGLKILIEGLI